MEVLDGLATFLIYLGCPTPTYLCVRAQHKSLSTHPTQPCGNALKRATVARPPDLGAKEALVARPPDPGKIPWGNNLASPT